MSVGKENHARERLVHHSSLQCHHDPSSRWSVAAASEPRAGSSDGPSCLPQQPDLEYTSRSHQRSAECRCRRSRHRSSLPTSAGCPGHGPGRPTHPAGAECCGAPGRGTERPRLTLTRRLCPRLPAALRHLVLLLLLSSVLRIAEGCSSRANPKPRGPFPSTRRPYTFNTEPCPEMYQERYCLNDATCFKVNIGHSPVYNCECTDGFMGRRCEYKDPDGSYSRSRDAIVEQASIAGGAGVALLVCLLLSGLLYVWSKRRRKAAASTGQLTPRFGLRQPSAHVVQMEPSAANQQPEAGDVIELQPADRWTPSESPAVEILPEDMPIVAVPSVALATAAGPSSAAAPAPAPVDAPVAPVHAPVAHSAAPASEETSHGSETTPTDPQSRHSDRPP